MATTVQASGAPTIQSDEVVVPFRWLILFGLVTAAIMEVLDTTIVNVALPQMMGNLGATRDEIGWVSTGYILSNVVVLPMTAWLASRFGRKNYLTVSVIIFIISSFFCGTSRTLGELVFWRILQGSGGAALLSTAQATLVEIFPRRMMGMVQAIFGLGIVVAPTLGPSLGGWITDNYEWPWVFFINVPIGILSCFIIWSFLPESKFQRNSSTIDWIGIILLAVGLGSLQYVLEEGRRYDWFDDRNITRLTILSAIALIAFVAWALSPKNKNPVVDLGVLKEKSLSAALVIGLALGFGLYGGVFILPQFLQNILHFTATETGLVLIPGGLITGASVIFCGRVLQKGVDPRILIAFGMITFMFSMWQLSHLTTSTGSDDCQSALMIRGLGLGFLFIPITVAAFSGLKGKDIAQGSALFNLSRQLGGSLGIAVLSTLLDTMTAFHRSDLIGNISSGNTLYLERSTTLSQHFTHTSGLSITASKGAALGVISQSVQNQSATMAYNDAFLLLGVSFLVAFPTLFLLRRPKPGGQGPGMAH